MRKKRGTLFIGNFFSEIYVSDAEDDGDDDEGDYF